MSAKLARTALADDQGRTIHSQLELFGLDTCLEMMRTDRALPATVVVARQRQLTAAHRVMCEDSIEDVSFLHAGLCQTSLPHSRPAANNEPWQRSNGRFHLVVEPGTVIDPATGRAAWVGVPFGTRTRLIMLYLNRHGTRGRRVHLGNSMTDWMDRLGIKATGGKNGSIRAVKEQSVRLGRARFSLQFENPETGALGISDTQLADHLHLWVTDAEGPWLEEIELTEKFHEHLREHAVPLSDGAISYLSGSSLKLDLYAWAAWRLPRLERSLRLNWTQVAATFSAAGEANKVAAKVREALVDVQTVYRDMKIETARHGLLLHPSKPPIPRTLIQVGGKR